MFQLIVMPQGIENVKIQLIPRSASKLGIDPINSHASYFGKSTGSNKRSLPLIELCLLIGTREYVFMCFLSQQRQQQEQYTSLLLTGLLTGVSW